MALSTSGESDNNCQIRALLPPAPTPLPNPAVAALKRKKQVLLNIDDKFKKEIEEWEVWEKAVNDMKVKSRIQQQQSSDPQLQPHPQLQLSSDFSLVDEYLSQAEALEDVIHNISNGCDVADALCTAAEEILKQSFFDLPVWAHLPLDLIKTLGEG